MLKRVLVPLDRSQLALCVLPHVAAIARIGVTEITLLHVLENKSPSHGEIDPVDWHLRKMEAKMYLDELAKPLQQVTGCTVDTQVLDGLAADRIIEFSQKQDFDLVALSSHGESGLSTWNVSGVAHKVMHHLGKSILLVRAYQAFETGQQEKWGALRYQRILVPLDGSARAECALPLATALAQQYTADLLLVHVVTPPEMLQRMPLTAEDTQLIEQVVDRNRNSAVKYFEQLHTRVSPEPQTHILNGENVAVALHEFAAQQASDLLLMSAHGRSGNSQWPLGDRVVNLLTYGATPLLIVQDLPSNEIGPTPTELVSASINTHAPLGGADPERAQFYAYAYAAFR